MLIYMISKMVGMVFGLLYPAYASFLAVKNKDVRGYVQWMMYWIVFAFYTFIESFADTFIGPWFPFYYELKICFLLWLMAPQTGGAGFLYRRFLHPKLVKYEPEIDMCLVNVQNQTTSFVFQWANRIVSAVIRAVTESIHRGAIRAVNHDVLSHHLLRTWSLNALQGGTGGGGGGVEDVDGTPPPARIRSSASVGATPSGELFDLETFLNERMEEDFGAEQAGSSRSRVIVLSEEILSDGEVEEPQRKEPKTRRRKKEVEVTEVNGRIHDTRRKRATRKKKEVGLENSAANAEATGFD